MRRILLAGLLPVFLVSCGNVKTLKPSEVEFLFIDVDPDTPTNYDTPFKAQIGAQMKTGEIRYLKDNSDFVCSHNTVCLVRDKTVEVLAVPPRFDADRVAVSLKMGNKQGDTIYSVDTLRLNFRAGISLGSTLRKAPDGGRGSDGNTALLFRDGRNGDNGLNGFPGATADSYEIHIWNDSATYYLHVRNLTTGLTGRYKIIGNEPFRLDASGGDGGNGGQGGAGGNGKDATTGDKQKPAGNGGTGGAGGSGGNGGDGGSIHCVLHPSAIDFRSQLKLTATGGRGGNGGEGGAAGKGGAGINNQAGGKNGLQGGKGWSGSFGRPGVVTITEQNFAIETMD